MASTVERIADSVELGEGPHWDVETQSLYYVDIFGKHIYKYTPSTKKLTKANIGKHVSFIIPVEGSKDRFLISMDRELVVITWDGVSPQVSKLEKIAEVENRPGVDGNRFNDGKADPTGRLWTGTMGHEPVVGNVDPKKGSLYSLGSNGQVKHHVSDVHISNGLAWSADLKKFYYIDSGERRVDQFDFDAKNQTISNRQPLFTLEKNNVDGFPDGQAIDADGNLWVAVFNGSRVIKIDPRKPETLLGSIEIPAKQVTSVAFGGPNLDELYVTSARMTINGVVLAQPDHGAVYRVTGLGVKGLPGVRVKL